MNARVRLALLGMFEARLAPSGRPLAVPKAKAKALLAYLALHPGQSFARDTLAALLWPEFAEGPARHSLRQTLFVLRKSVPSIDLLVAGDGIALRPTSVSVDAGDLERLAANGTPEALAEAAALYRGDLLDGLRVTETPFEDWLLGERERLRGLGRGVLQCLMEHERKVGRSADAIHTATRLLTVDPLDESAHRALMELHAANGHRGHALRQYQLCTATLQRELGVRPEPETTRLYQEVLEQKVAPIGPGAARRGIVAVPRPGIPLVGRERELAALSRALDQAWEGAGRVVTILGEAGVGKSCLAETLAASVHTRGGRSLVGRAYEMEQILPFGPWLDALRAVATDDGGALSLMEPVWRRELGRLFPELGSSDPPPSGDGGGYVRLFEAVLRLVRCLSGDSPLVLVFEDLHWADDMTLRLLSFVARHVHDRRVLIVATAREEELAESVALRRCLEALERNSPPLRLHLAALSEADTATLTQSLAPSLRGTLALADLEQRVWEASEGSPFVIVETVREVLEGRLPFDAATATLPAPVRAVIAARLDGLDERAATLIAVAAVIGRDFEPALLAGASMLGAADVSAAVDVLVRRRLLAVRDGRLDFTHDRIREVAWSRLLPPRRTFLHARVGRAIEELYCGDLVTHAGRLAMHYREGEIWDKALVYLPLAGRQALARAAYRHAAVCFEQALAMLSRCPDVPGRMEQAIDLRLHLRTALQPLGELDRALKRLAEAERLSNELGDSRRLGWSLSYRSQGLWNTGQLVDARTEAQRALAIAEAVGDGELAAVAGRYLGQACFSMGDYREASEHLTTAMRGFDRRRSPTDKTTTPGADRYAVGGYDPAETGRAWLAWALGERGEFEAGILVGWEGMRLAQASGHANSLSMVGIALAELYCIRGELPAAVEILQRSLALVRQHDLQGAAFPVVRTLGYAYALGGQVREGVALLQEAATIAESLDHRRPHIARFLEQLGRGHLLAGRLRESREHASRALARARARDERGAEAYALRLLADIAHADGPDGDAAEAQYREAIALAAQLGMRPLMARCHRAIATLYRRLGRSKRAREHLALAMHMASEMQLRDLGT